MEPVITSIVVALASTVVSSFASRLVDLVRDKKNSRLEVTLKDGSTVELSKDVSKEEIARILASLEEVNVSSVRSEPE